MNVAKVTVEVPAERESWASLRSSLAMAVNDWLRRVLATLLHVSF